MNDRVQRLSNSITSAGGIYQAWDAQQIMCGLSSSRADATKMAFQRGRLAEIAGVAAALFSLIAFMLGYGLALGGVLPRA